MINIISKNYCHSLTSGPQKVVRNLIKGLDLIQYPYVINRRLDACRRLWIHDDLLALRQIRKLDPNIKVIVGPNLVVLPRHLPADADLSRVVYLHPSAWSKAFWEDFGFNACLMAAWPTGIDTKEFAPRNATKDHVMVYFKERYPEELATAEQLLKEKNISYKILRYSSYTNEEYKNLLSHARYVLWIGRQESQGIALQEALASGVPILVWDVTKLGHWLGPEKAMRTLFTEAENNFQKATAAEYFDATCGIKIKDARELSPAIDQMELKWTAFEPRRYIVDHLSLQKQARDFVALYQTYFDLTFERGLQEQVLRRGSWINNYWPVRAYYGLQDIWKLIKRA